MMIRLFYLLVFTTSFATAAWSKVRIDVAYDQIADEVQPESKQFSSRGGTSLILNDDGTITKSSTGGVSTNSIDGYVSSINKAGISATAHYRIKNGSITEYYENMYIRQTITIRTNGQDLCSARMIASAPRGQKYIIWGNPTRYISHIEPINVTCRIQKMN